MSWIKKLQAKPYGEKIRIIWIAMLVTGIIILGIWLLTLKFRKMEQIDGSKFAPLKESFNQLKELKFTK